MKKLVTENVFCKFDRETYYFLGLLATDGSIYENRIELRFKREDVDILYKYRDFLKADVKIGECYKRIDNKIFYSNRVSFRNQEIVDFLKNLGITNNKTFNLKLNINFNFDLLRGIIDGDGCFITKTNKRCHRMTIVSASEEFISQISKFLNEWDIKHVLKNRKHRYFYLHVRQTESLLKLIEYLYNDTQTFINRKFVTAYNIRNNIMKMRQIRGTSVKNPEPSLIIY